MAFLSAVNLYNLLFSDYRKKQEYLRARKKALEKIQMNSR